MNVSIDIDNIGVLADVIYHGFLSCKKDERDGIGDLLKRLETTIEESLDKYEEGSLEHQKLQTSLRHVQRLMCAKNTYLAAEPAQRAAMGITPILHKMANIYVRFLKETGVPCDNPYMSTAIMGHSEEGADGVVLMAYNNTWKGDVPEIRIFKHLKWEELGE